MFGYILAGVTAAAFGGIALRESLKTTGEKVRNGDTVFANADALRVVSGAGGSDNAAANASLRSFLAGFITTNVKVTNVALGSAQGIIGDIIGFPFQVAFPPAAVTSIERNGRRIT